MKPSPMTMFFGMVVFLAALAAWFLGAERGIDTSIVWTVATPLVLALFVGQGITAAGDAAKQAAANTNGVLDGRIKAAVSAALADRDAARTRQAQGDAGGPTQIPADPG